MPSKKNESESLLPKDVPDYVTKPIPREKLPDDLQKLIDKDESFMDDLYDGNLGDTTESNMRYAAYANRLRTIMLSAHRYVAYTSDVGESFRPIAHPYLVKSAYAVSWAYLIGDVSHEGWKAYKRNEKLKAPVNDEHMSALVQPDGKVTGAGQAQALVQNASANGQGPVKIPAIEDWKAVVAQRAVFQSVASMGLPAFTIHSIVRYSGRALKNASNTTIRTWGPIGLGLAAVPALPFLFDKPVEEAVEWTFYNAFKAIGGEGAVGPRHSTGREHSLQAEVKALKEKEL